ncbi:hypothetical protein [Leptospira interrogans]|uniref:hypothetical protein n=1 Tax=Leptospira interrogans TaxID=173 RepID=UPI0007742FBA|nr:hypothetical protein [Leptospira interrogans]
MQKSVIEITEASQKIIGIDITMNDSWIGVTEFGIQQSIIINGSPYPVPEECQFPIIRLLNDQSFILADTRTKKNRSNLWIIDYQGKVINSFRVGDSIQDIVAFKDGIVVTYFDEAFGNSEGLDGMVFFNFKGEVNFHYSEVECYCASTIDTNQLLTFFYPDFKAIVFNLRDSSHTIYESPPDIAGASAVTCFKGTPFFHGSYKDKSGVHKWNLGSKETKRIGEIPGSIRGLKNGRFLAYYQSIYSVLSIEDSD